MKEITLFYQEGCPHCQNARQMVEQLTKDNAQYAQVPLKLVEETQEPDLANQYDYFLVPTFYVGQEKLHEGVPTQEAVEAVFAAALKD